MKFTEAEKIKAAISAFRNLYVRSPFGGDITGRTEDMLEMPVSAFGMKYLPDGYYFTVEGVVEDPTASDRGYCTISIVKGEGHNDVRKNPRLLSFGVHVWVTSPGKYLLDPHFFAKIPSSPFSNYGEVYDFLDKKVSETTLSNV